jgi:diguanylate cyclase (GGDEF)-like protein/PAS domain S-box-containing protein
MNFDDDRIEHLSAEVERLRQENSKLIERLDLVGTSAREGVTGSQLAQEWLRILGSAIQSAGEGIMLMSASKKPFRVDVLFVNEGFTRITGVPKEEATGNPLRLLRVVDDDREVVRILMRHLETEEKFFGEVTAERGSGETYALEIQVVPVYDDGSGRLTHWVAILRDVTERRKQLEALQRQALHDVLTGLPNWGLLEDRLQQTIYSATRRNEQTGLMILDLDRFKDVNDTYGHNVGDEILRAVGDRVVRQVRKSDTVARIGGDEYAVLLPGVGGEIEAGRLARKILTAFETPIEVRGSVFDVSPSIGIALSPQHGDDSESLHRRADIAMYVAKESMSGYAIYSEKTDRHRTGHLAMAQELRQAIDRDELTLHYQPKAHLRTGLVTRVEALVRWRHPEKGLISPAQFIPLAERTGLIKPMTDKILDMALRQCREWRQLGTPMSVAVNLSTRTLQESFLVDLVLSLLEKWEVDPGYLKLEITESSVLSEPDRVIDILETLRRKGVHFSLDDFGTGYSSLSYLRKLPVDEIKIDKSFVTDMVRNESDAEIVSATINLAHNLGRQVVAEGIEDEATWDMLRELGCDLGQGYYLSKPLPPDELSRWLSETRMGLDRKGKVTE